MRNQTVIRTLIREMLNENTQNQYSDMGIVTIPGSYSTDPNLTVVYSISKMNVALTGANFGAQGQIFVSGVEWGKSPYTRHGPCNNGFVIMSSVTKATEKGWGKKAYLAAIATAQKSGKSLGPDRDHVSPSAAAAWEEMSKNLDAHPYDDLSDPKTPPPEDDCKLDPERPVLNASYTLKSIPSDISTMMQQGEGHFGQLTGEQRGRAMDILRKQFTVAWETSERTY